MVIATVGGTEEGQQVDEKHFVGWARQLSRGWSRRHVVMALTALGLAADRANEENAAAKKRKKKKKCRGCGPCETCVKGTCAVQPDGAGCGACRHCQSGECVAKADNAACDDGFCKAGSCVPCGLEGQFCCPGSFCLELECDVDGQCGVCGGDSERCCAGSTCDPNLGCSQAQKICLPLR
jgi:hypothetical protein